jgi:transcriptional regulator with XRE-family HTH domain
MSRTLYSPRHKAMREFIRKKRKERGLTQAELAELVGRYQSFIADLERGERRLDVIEFLDFSDALRFDPAVAIRIIKKATG